MGFRLTSNQDQRKRDRAKKEATEKEALKVSTAHDFSITGAMPVCFRRYQGACKCLVICPRAAFLRPSRISVELALFADSEPLDKRQAETMKEYNRLLDEQEEQRAQELAARMERSDPSMSHHKHPQVTCHPLSVLHSFRLNWDQGIGGQGM